MHSSRKLTIEELANLKLQNKISPTQSSKPSLDCYHYNQRLKNGESMSEILKSATPEEEMFISKNFDLYKYAQDELSKKKLESIFSCFRNKITLQEMVSELDLSELFFIAQNLDVIQQEEWRQFNSQNSLGEGNLNLHQQKIQPYQSEKLANMAPKNFYSEPKINKPCMISYQYQQASQEKGDDDDDDDLVVTFGKTVNGLTFREILKDYQKHQSWLRWLKFEHHKATSDQELAKKAYRYFEKRVPNWSKLQPFNYN